VLAAGVVSGVPASIEMMLAAPMFVVALGTARLLAGALEAVGRPTLRPLLLAQLMFLLAFMVLAIAGGSTAGSGAPVVIAASMFGVAAMAVQNALVHLSLKNAPSTAVMTTNVTLLVLDIGEVLLALDVRRCALARARAARTWPAVVGFLV